MFATIPIKIPSTWSCEMYKDNLQCQFFFSLIALSSLAYSNRVTFRSIEWKIKKEGCFRAYLNGSISWWYKFEVYLFFRERLIANQFSLLNDIRVKIFVESSLNRRLVFFERARRACPMRPSERRPAKYRSVRTHLPFSDRTADRIYQFSAGFFRKTTYLPARVGFWNFQWFPPGKNATWSMQIGRLSWIRSIRYLLAEIF